MTQHSKRYNEAAAKIDPETQYPPSAAVSMAKETSAGTKFDSTIEAHVRLGVDPRHADQMVRGSVVLPHGTGKKQKIVVFAQGDKVREARDAGADEVGGEDLAKRVQEGWTDFDVALATPDMMGTVGKLGKILGPARPDAQPQVQHRHLRPGPRHQRRPVRSRWSTASTRPGSSTASSARLRSATDQLLDNFSALMESIVKAKPSATKGVYVKSVNLAGTMSPAAKVDPGAASKLTQA